MSWALATAIEQDKDVPATTTASEPGAHWLQAPQAVQSVHPELYHFQYFLYQISPL